MPTAEGGARAPRVCMVAYHESPSQLPPMLHEGLTLAQDGFEVEVLCLAASDGAAGRETFAPGFSSRRLPIRTRRFFHALLGRGNARGPVAVVQWALTYAEYLAKASAAALASGADSYEAHDLPTLLPAVLAAKLRRKPVVYRAHELWPETHAKVQLAWFWRLLDRTLVPRCDEVITPDERRSTIYRDELGARRPPLTVRNCPPWRPPVESASLRDELERRGVRASTIVLYQGLIDSGRCIEELAEASRRFDPGLVLVLLGSGAGRWAEPTAALAGYDRIVALPRVAYGQVARYTASADVGVLLYRNDCRNNYLCAPNKLFEYMMMGLPVVAPAFPGMRALVEGEESGDVGLCVDPSDPAQIADAVNRIARDPAARARMRANGLHLARERYNWEVESLPLLARHRELVGLGAPSRAAPEGRSAPRWSLPARAPGP